MGQKIVQVDAFTSEAFKGNPAAVCVMSGAASEDWMQKVAREMNLSETAFLYPTGDSYSLRWFTPAAEVALCGHATLATAHVLYTEHGCDSGRELQFDTKSGRLTARRNGDWLELNFPASKLEDDAVPSGLLEALGVTAVNVRRAKWDWLVEVASVAEVRNVTPNFSALMSVEARGIIVTARGDDGRFDFVSRFFAPKVGVNEDPVTGSAHCALTPYWAAKLGKQQMLAYQASARGGEIRVQLDGDRVRLGGQAVTVLRGELV